MPAGTICLNCMTAYLNNGVCPRCGMSDTEPGRSEDALARGTMLNRFLIGRVLGQGGFGITYLALDTQYRRRVALKELFPRKMLSRAPDSSQIAVDPPYRQYFEHLQKRFHEEANRIYQLRKYPEIIRIYDLFSANGTSYYTMQYLDGQTISHLVQDSQGVSWERIQQPVRDCVQTLKIIHRHGFIHRDISPENIFLQKQGRTMLIDFGSMRREDASRFTTILNRRFAPKEQFRAREEQGAWTDVFSLSASIYYLLGGHYPTDAMRRQQEIGENRPDPLAALQDYQPNAPDYVVQAVMKGMSFYAQDRWQNMDEFEAAFFPSQRLSEPVTRLICVSGLLMGRSFSLQRNCVIRLGRGSNGNTIALPDSVRGVSRQQCALYLDEAGTAFIQDQQSRFGTRVDNQTLKPLVWYKVRNGQLISFGAQVFRLV